MPDDIAPTADYRYEVNVEQEGLAPEESHFDNEAAALKFAQDRIDMGASVGVWQVSQEGDIVRMWISFAGALKAVE